MPELTAQAPVAVPIIAGTAVAGALGSMFLYRSLKRHPQAFIVTLSGFGLTRSISDYQVDLTRDIEAGLARAGLPPDSRLVLVGHSQGGLAAARFAVDHPQWVAHTITVGTPWGGLGSAAHLRTVLSVVPAVALPTLRDMSPDSPFLADLKDSLTNLPGNITNIYSASDLVLAPYTTGHIENPRVRNVLLADPERYRAHLESYPHLVPDEVIFRSCTHFDEMNCPEVRSLVWQAADLASSGAF